MGVDMSGRTWVEHGNNENGIESDVGMTIEVLGER
jgi:hypothetical protein